MLTVFDRRILFFDEGNEVVEEVSFECCESLDLVRCHHVFAHAVVLHGPAVWHNHDHRFDLPVCIKVIEDYLWLTSVEPFLFIATDAMQQIENRVFDPSGVGGRSVDHSLSGCADSL